MANHRQPQPHGLTPTPLHPQPLQEVRSPDAPQVRVLPRRRWLVGGDGQVLPQDPRRGVRRPAQDRRRQAHHLQLQRHDVVALRRVLAPGGAKVCLAELFSAKRIESYEHIRREEVRALLRDLHAASGRVVALKDYLSAASLNVISRMVLGKKYLEREVVHEGEVVTTPERFRWMIDELFLLNGVLDIGDSIPWLGWLDLQGYIRRMKKLSKMFDQFLEYVLDEHENRMCREGESFVAKDMVDVLLNVASDPSLEVKFSRDSVKAFTQDFTELSPGTKDPSHSPVKNHQTNKLLTK
ncbi:hypothetical protein OsJ_26207 [Oryza sativa Japonica Group]|uniref:Uncharacterized protein n=1 Tax=Oryza sativa subsp. japonica TaxID=39947 RepID=A3BQ31_ORYSJ|nr:hypothetical protein OsJ_26207 [Oryza sativa Japonica Group]